MSSDNFKKYGFEKPEFECEILKEFRSDYKDKLLLIGYVTLSIGETDAPYLYIWDRETGYCYDNADSRVFVYDLKPVLKEKPWYKDLNNKDKLVKFNGEFVVFLKYYQDQEVIRINFGGIDCYVQPDEVKILTNEEIDSLIIKE